MCMGQGIGNMVMATPVLRAGATMGFRTDVHLQANYPEAADLLRGLPGVGDVTKLKPLRRYDVVIRTLHHCGPELGLGPEVGPEDGALGAMHETDAHMSAIRKLGFTGPTPAPKLCCAEPSVPLPDRYLVCAPGYSRALNPIDWARKAWPHWAEFCAAFRAAFPTVGIVALGGPDAADLWPGGADQDCFGLPLLESAGVLKRAAAVVSLDSGLAHVAAALGAPVRALFGGTNEVKNRPIGHNVRLITANVSCRPCQWTAAWDTCTDWRCMAHIRPARVVESLKEVLW